MVCGVSPHHAGSLSRIVCDLIPTLWPLLSLQYHKDTMGTEEVGRMTDGTHAAKCTETVCSGACREWPVAERGMEPAEPASVESVRTLIDVPGMDCPVEEGMIRSRLSRIPGIEALDCNLLERRLTLTASPGATKEAVSALGTLGLGATVRDESSVSDKTAEPKKVGHGPVVSRRTWALLAVAAVAALSAEVLHLVMADGRWLVIGLSLSAVALGGLETYWKDCWLSRTAPKHQRSHDHCRHRCHGHRRMAGSSHGHGAICVGGTHGGSLCRPGSARHPESRRDDARDGHCSAGRRDLDRG